MQNTVQEIQKALKKQTLVYEHMHKKGNMNIVKVIWFSMYIFLHHHSHYKNNPINNMV